jgi:hypothetical protein
MELCQQLDNVRYSLTDNDVAERERLEQVLETKRAELSEARARLSAVLDQDPE